MDNNPLPQNNQQDKPDVPETVVELAPQAPEATANAESQVDPIDEAREAELASVASTEAETAPVAPESVAATSAIAAPEVSKQVFVKEKRSLLWLWILLGIVITLLIAVAISYFVIKANADKVGSDFVASTKTYLKNVYDAANSTAPDPETVKSRIDKLEKPSFKAPFMGSVSNTYTASITTNTAAIGHVQTLRLKLDQLQSVSKFNKDWTQFNEELVVMANAFNDATTRTEFIASLHSMGGKYSSGKSIITAFDAPDDLVTAKQDLVKQYDKLIQAVGTMVSSFESNDRTGYGAGYAQYVSATTAYETALKPIKTYNDTLSTKIHDAAKELQSYTNTLK